MSIEVLRMESINRVMTDGNNKRLSILPTDNGLDHVSWSAMTILIIKYRDGKTSERENRHIFNMAQHLGMEEEAFVGDIEARIEQGLIMSTGVLIGVNAALKLLTWATTPEEIHGAMSHFDTYMNFF